MHLFTRCTSQKACKQVKQAAQSNPNVDAGPRNAEGSGHASVRRALGVIGEGTAPPPSTIMLSWESPAEPALLRSKLRTG